MRLESLSEQGQVLPKVSVSFVEISGDLCFDLFNAFAETQILAGNDGSFHAFPVVEPCVSSPEELIALIQFARSIRTTAATGVHDASSRSHAVLKIYVHRPVAPTAAAGASIYDMATTSYAEGTLTLVIALSFYFGALACDDCSNYVVTFAHCVLCRWILLALNTA